MLSTECVKPCICFFFVYSYGADIATVMDSTQSYKSALLSRAFLARRTQGTAVLLLLPL